MFGTANSLNSAKRFIILGLFISSCSEQSGQDECFYERYDTHAEVVEIKPDPADSTKRLVMLEFMGSSLAFETQELGALREEALDQDFVERNKIKTGNRYEVVVSEITEGNCTPRFVTFNHSLE